jgi:hypothetical protein
VMFKTVGGVHRHCGIFLIWPIRNSEQAPRMRLPSALHPG